MRVRIKVYLETIIIIQQRKQIVLKMQKKHKESKRKHCGFSADRRRRNKGDNSEKA